MMIIQQSKPRMSSLGLHHPRVCPKQPLQLWTCGERGCLISPEACLIIGDIETQEEIHDEARKQGRECGVLLKTKQVFHDIPMRNNSYTILYQLSFMLTTQIGIHILYQIVPNCHLYSQHRLGCFEILDVHVRIFSKKATILIVMSFESARSLIITYS